MRNLVSIRTISGVNPIPGADRICEYKVDGWSVVDRVGEFAVGDECVYFEIDSWIPTTIAPFLSKGKEPREFEGIPGERLRTIRLKKTLSQGLILKVSDLSVLEGADPESDLASLLGVVKYEKPLHASLQGTARGNFPSFVPKTDQERVQNCWNKIPRDTEFEVTIKIDGSSMTTYFNDGVFGVCSRNLDLKDTEGNSFWDKAKQLDLQGRMASLGRNIAIQGELWGERINGNWEGINRHEFSVFDVYDIDAKKYLGSKERRELVRGLGIDHAPVLDTRRFDFQDINEALAWTEGPSIINRVREGTVWKSVDGSYSFKVISNAFLLGSGG